MAARSIQALSRLIRPSLKSRLIRPSLKSNVQEPRPHRPAAPLEPEGMAFGRCVQDRFVDDVVVAVQASHGFEALDE